MDHTREHRSVLASAEKRLLVAIATRLPRWLHSDHLTLLGLVSMPAAGLAFSAIGTAERGLSRWRSWPTGSATAWTALSRESAVRSDHATASTSIT